MKTHVKSLGILPNPEQKHRLSSARLYGHETESLCIALAVLEITPSTRAGLKLKRPTYFCFPSARIKVGSTMLGFTSVT